MMSEFTKHVNNKFHKDGKAREFLGNTVICHIPSSSPTMKMLLELREAVLQEPWHQKMAMLPPSSYHMTVFELVCDQVRDAVHWTNLLPLESTMEETDERFSQIWETLPAPPEFSISFDYLDIKDYITMRLKPSDEEANQIIRDYRNQLSEAFGLRQSNHESYFFHISMSYAVWRLTNEDLEEAAGFVSDWKEKLEEYLSTIDLQPTCLTFFNDMTHFANKRREAQWNVTE
ncbi:MAG: DUF1868 domain-containing protein [Anaerolineaceae bacterium]|nr:DUF1868 domain-containing protein [Anaerolineaceae bacterium]